MNKNVIGLVGYAGAGKDTAAGLMGIHGEYCIEAFADPLKRMLLSLVDSLGVDTGNRDLRPGWPGTILDPLKNKQIGATPDHTVRHAMQTLGTEWGRNMIDQDLWIRCARHQASLNLERGWKTVFTDVRFHNEADLIIHELDGQLWFIDRGEQTMAHESERYVHELKNRCLQVIDNRGSMEQFERTVKGLVT